MRRSFLRHTLLLTAVHLAIRTSALLFHIYLSRRIGAAGMGRLQLVLTASGFALTLGVSGSRAACMNLTAAQRGLGRPSAMKQAIVSSLRYCALFSVFAGMLLFIGAETLAAGWIRDADAAPVLRLTGLCVPLHCTVAVLYGCFTARGRIRPLVITELTEQAVDIFITLAALQLWAGADFSRIGLAVIGGSAAGAMCSLCILGAQLLRDLHPIPNDGSRMLRPLLRLTVPLALSDYLRSGLDTAEQFLIPYGLRRAGDSYERSMADYGTICGMVFPVLMFPSVLFISLSDLLLPELSGSKARGEQQRIQRVAVSCLQCGFVFSAVIAGLLFLLGPQLGELLFHSKSAGAYLRAFSPLVLFLYTDRLVDGMLKGLGEQVACVRYNTITSFLDVVLLLVLLPRLGVTGFFITFTLTHLLNLGLSLRRLCRSARIVPDLSHALRTVTAVAAATTFCLLLPQNGTGTLVIAAALYCAFSLCLCFITDALSPELLRQFIPKKKTAGDFSRRKALI
ncbi:MAG: polysaccharide biosynthesis C-terminal domain-containing protein [Oscillospiraceae bacterium]|nr:polysaccharide biosynthesis C-terminal domain-containing protein [Oscillospiraceae bacterium]